MKSKGKAETAARDKTFLALRIAVKGAPGGTRAVSLVALVLLFLSLAGCAASRSVGANPPAIGSYPLHKLARDISVGEGAFLAKAVEHHGAECRSLCTLDTIKDKNFCVGLCNAIKAAGEQHRLLNAALDMVCSGPGWREGTAPCQLDADLQARAAKEAELQKRVDSFRGAMDTLKKTGGGQ